jgi:predicted amidohydrolase
VRQWPGQRYIAEGWMPVRDQANGSVLVATARVPDTERAAHIADVLENPVEFAAATLSDIRAAVLRAFAPEANRAVLAGLRLIRRKRERGSALAR